MIRGLLEANVVDVSLQPMGEVATDPLKQVWLWWAVATEDRPAYVSFRIMYDEKPLRFATMTEVPALILALLDASSRVQRTEVETGVRVGSAFEYVWECAGCGGWAGDPTAGCPRCGRESALRALKEAGR